MTGPSQILATVRPGPELCIWSDGALLAAVHLSDHAALNVAIDILQQLRGRDLSPAAEVADGQGRPDLVRME